MMTIDLEDELRQAFSQLPDEQSDPSGTIAGSRRGAVRIRRRRTTGVCAGAVAAALVVGGAIAVGTGFPTSGGHTGLAPAGRSKATTTTKHRTTAPRFVIPPPPATTKQPPQPKEDTDKPLHGVSGRLLPHGKQLPHGLLYRGAFTYDYTKTWSTSLADGYRYAVPIVGLIGADQSLNGPTTAQINAAYGIVSSAIDSADSSGSDTSPNFRWLGSSIVRFRSPALAKSAIAKAQRGEGGMYWIRPKVTAPNVAWSGVRGVAGDHGVYTMPNGAAPDGYLAYQVVGEYIVSAQAASAVTAEQGVTDMVANLTTAGLLP